MAGVGVDADEAGDLAGDAGFLEGFADGGLGEGFAEVDGAAGECPVVVVGALDEQDLAGRERGRSWRLRLRCCRWCLSARAMTTRRPGRCRGCWPRR